MENPYTQSTKHCNKYTIIKIFSIFFSFSSFMFFLGMALRKKTSQIMLEIKGNMILICKS